MEVQRSKDQRLTKVLTRFYRDEVGLPHWREAVVRTQTRSPEAKFKRLERFVTFKGKKVLDVGCGFGDLTHFISKCGATTVIGIEPDFASVVAARGLNSKGEVLYVNGVGEYLPFGNETFDLVVSNMVLEHVKMPKVVINEMVRVLKSEGYIWISVPNYLFPMEPHYQLMWIPYLPRRVARKYAAWRGRNPDFLKSINYITPFKMKKWLHEAGLTIKFYLIQEAISDPTLILSNKWRLVARLLKRFVPFFPMQLFSPIISVIVEKPRELPEG